jgi:hypothetical protein
VNRIPTKWKIIVVAVTVLIVVTGAFVILHLTNIQSPSSPPTNASSTPAPTETPEQFVVTTVTASPSNATPGLVTVIAEVRNDGTQNETVLVIMQIQEPNGDIMSIANNSSPLEIPAGESKTTTFEPRIPLNVKIGKFNVDIDVYDLNQTTKYYSTGFIYPFTTPIRYYFHFDRAAKISFSMTVDGVTYYDDTTFYWYLGETHTITVPHIVMVNDVYGWIFDGWGGPNGNILLLNVTADGPTDIEITYGLYYP